MLPSSSPSLSRTGSFEDLLAATEVAPSSSSASPNLENEKRGQFLPPQRLMNSLTHLLRLRMSSSVDTSLLPPAFANWQSDMPWSSICLPSRLATRSPNKFSKRNRIEGMRIVSQLIWHTFTICARHVHWNTWREWSKRSESHVHKIVICFVYHCSKKFNIHRSSLILLRIKSMLFRAKLT